MHNVCIFLFICSKIMCDQKLFPSCFDKFDYLGSIVYLSCLRERSETLILIVEKGEFHIFKRFLMVLSVTCLLCSEWHKLVKKFDDFAEFFIVPCFFDDLSTCPTIFTLSERRNIRFS